jgi:hypothetical protein
MLAQLYTEAGNAPREGRYPNTSSPINSRGVADMEAAVLCRRGLQRVWIVLRGGLKQRASEEEISNSAVVILALFYYSKVHSLCVQQ